MKKLSKKYIVLSFIILSLSVIVFLKDNNGKVVENNYQTKTNLISMMVEQSDGTYKEEKSQKFVTDGYILNPYKSGCEGLGKLTWNESQSKVEADLLTSDKCYAYFDIYNLEKYCDYTKEDSLVCDVVRKKDNTLIYHDGLSDYKEEENVSLEADDFAYRFAGSFEKVNNYVCFGSKDETCPYDNLYRIIGLFKNEEGKYEAKLIKADYANKNLLGSGNINPNGTPDYNANGSFFGLYGNKNGTDEERDGFIHRYCGNLSEVNRYRYQETGTEKTVANWPTALLNTIHLNHNFLNTFSNSWQDKIVGHKWHYKGSTFDNIAVASKTSSSTIRTSFDYEVGSKADKTLTDPIKIGLMYISDYLYSASPNNWNKKPYNGTTNYVPGEPDSNGNPQGTYEGSDGTDYRSAIDENWMYLGLWEWTITQRTDVSVAFGFTINAPGYIYGCSFRTGDVVRPTFYIKSDTKLKSGNGTKESPYRLSI